MEGEKKVLITGASRGLGKAMADKFRRSGWQVFATDLVEGEGIIPMDVISDASVKGVFTTLQEQGTILDLIINNAGIDRYFPFFEAPVENFKNIFEVNLFGAYRVNQVFLPLLPSPGGRIIMIGSESLNLTIPFMPYPLTKNCLERYAKVLRQELRFLGIDVVVLRPGAIATSLLKAVSSIHWSVEREELKRPFRRFAEQASAEVNRVITPEKTAEFVYRLACRPHPKPVYRINNMMQLKLTSLIPFRILEKAVYRRLR